MSAKGKGDAGSPKKKKKGNSEKEQVNKDLQMGLKGLKALLEHTTNMQAIKAYVDTELETTVAVASQHLGMAKTEDTSEEEDDDALSDNEVEEFDIGTLPEGIDNTTPTKVRNIL